MCYWKQCILTITIEIDYLNWFSQVSKTWINIFFSVKLLKYFGVTAHFLGETSWSVARSVTYWRYRPLTHHDNIEIFHQIMRRQIHTRILLHVRDVAARGYKQVNILCRYTYVLALIFGTPRAELSRHTDGTSRQRCSAQRFANPRKMLMPYLWLKMPT